jgi:hypothetical protein
MIVQKENKKLIGLAIVSVLAVSVFYILSPKHWFALSVASPIPPIP